MNNNPNELHKEIAELKRENQQLKKKIDYFQKNSSLESKEDNFNFSDLIDSNLVQNLMNQFYALTGYPIGIIDLNHNIIVATGWQPICTDFYRTNKESCKLCKESDLFIQNNLKEGKFIEYKCKNGLWDIAQPIHIDGKHMATIFLGQFFYDDENIDESFFVQQANKYNFDKSEFLQAAKQAPRFSRKEIKQLMTYYEQLAQILSHQGYLNLKHLEELKLSEHNKIELIRNKNKLDTIINAIPSPFYAKDLDGTFLLCNESFAEKLKLKPIDIIGKTDFDIVPKKFALHNRQKDLELIKNPGKQIYTTTAHLSDGTEHHIIFHKSSYTDEYNKIAGVTGVAVSITEQIRIKKDLEIAKEKAEESDRLKSAFLANMSHEIRTPLNSIIGFADMLKNPSLPQLKKDKFINIINTCGEQLLSLISDIIDISKIEANQINFEEEVINLNDLIDSFFEVFKSKAKEQNLELLPQKALQYQSANIKTDAGKIQQILTNLIVNALKFTKQGSITFGYRIEEDQFELFVKDSGIGISKANQTKIFDRFYRIENNEIEHSGTGLGLSITKGFVELMQGNIQVISKLNQGTEIKIYLPLKRTQDKLEKKELLNTESNYAWSDICILIAEDEETNYMYLEEVLLPTGAQLIWAKNGKEAVEICSHNSDINLVLMDLKMPILNGYEAAESIKKFRQNLPIIAQTAYAFANDRQKALNSGCNDYITKPIQMQDLYKIIDKNLRSTII